MVFDICQSKRCFILFDELVAQIKADCEIQKKIQQPLSTKIFHITTCEDQSATDSNDQFINFQILLDCMLRSKSTEEDRVEFLNCCRIQYRNNRTELNHIDEFEKDYSSDKVLWWYTRESFFYKTLNAAFRTENIRMMFLCRGFITDIYKQLQLYQVYDSLRVYRSQMILTEELNTLKNCIGQFISINSFFSTSTDRSLALSCFAISHPSNGLERVLFEIHAAPFVGMTQPFANIRKYSYFTTESEILFMIGSMFYLESIERSNDQLWIIRLNLCGDYENIFKQIFVLMKKQMGLGEMNCQTLGKILWKRGEFDLAEKYFNLLSKELPRNDPLLSGVYQDLADIALQSNLVDKSVHWHKKSLDQLRKHKQSTTNSKTKKSNNRIHQVHLQSHTNNTTKWEKNGITIAGRNGHGNQLDQLNKPHGIYIDDYNKTIYIAVRESHCIIEWKFYADSGHVVMGASEHGQTMDQLSYPTDVLIDKENDTLVVCDHINGRVVQCSRRNGKKLQRIISGLICYGLTIDNNGDLYVSDHVNHEVIRLKQGDTHRTVVAGGNGKGNHLNQLSYPTYVFVDQDYSVYVSDHDNHRVMKWPKGAKQGIVVAGGQGQGKSLNQLNYPAGVIVDQSNNVYVVDSDNHRIMRWLQGSNEGSIIAGDDQCGEQSNQLSYPQGLSFDQQGNLYVADTNNNRIQQFEIDCSQN